MRICELLDWLDRLLKELVLLALQIGAALISISSFRLSCAIFCNFGENEVYIGEPCIVRVNEHRKFWSSVTNYYGGCV